MHTKTSAASQEGLLQPPAAFRKEVIRAISFIIGFVIGYIVLLLLSVGLVALCVGLGMYIISARPSFYTLLLGGGVMACGIMVFVFLIKFLFASGKPEEEDRIEIFPNDEPLLFKTINELAEAAGTFKPKKVFLSADVNACVFYHSSFWSMFLPVRKNLKIGLGLVNSLNVSELKAVIAHEFGHFSQKSMKVGSWVYQVNKIIYDLLYNNSGYASSLDNMSRIHGIFALFAQITVKVVQGIQWVLRQMYLMVNKSYMGLSRQMEFHADTMAAMLCGSNNVVSSLQRIEFAAGCYQVTIGLCNIAWKEKKVAANFFDAHAATIQHISNQRRLPLENGLPLLEGKAETISYRVNYKDQWASHPTLEERRQYLEPLGLDAGEDKASAWTLFSNPVALGEKLTRKIYADVPATEVQAEMDVAAFTDLLRKNYEQYSFPEIFKDYYSGRQVSVFDVVATVAEPFVIPSFDQVFTEEVAALPKRIQYLKQDIEVLKAIAQKHIDAKSFDFDGHKYHRRDAETIALALETNLQELEAALISADAKLFRYFYAIAPLADSEGLKQDYLSYFALQQDAAAFCDLINEMMKVIAPVFQGQTLTIEEANGIAASLKEQHEPAFKKALAQWAPSFETANNLKEKVAAFMAADFQYFFDKSFFENELNELHQLATDCWEVIDDYTFTRFKGITEKQAAFLLAKGEVPSLQENDANMHPVQ